MTSKTTNRFSPEVRGRAVRQRRPLHHLGRTISSHDNYPDVSCYINHGRLIVVVDGTRFLVFSCVRCQCPSISRTALFMARRYRLGFNYAAVSPMLSLSARV